MNEMTEKKLTMCKTCHGKGNINAMGFEYQGMDNCRKCPNCEGKGTQIVEENIKEIQMVTVGITKELFDRLSDEREEFEKSINIKFSFEQTIWELLKIANYNKGKGE